MIHSMMSKHGRTPWVAAGILIACGLPAMAQSAKQGVSADEDYRYEVGIFGGGQFWKLRQSHNPAPEKLTYGGLFGLRFGADFLEYLGVEVSYTVRGWNNLKLPTVPGTPVSSVSLGARNAQLMAGPMFYFTPRSSRFRPFVTAGPALQYFFPTSNAKSQAQSASFANGSAAQIASKYGPALVFGGGAKYMVTRRIDVRADIRGILAENPHFNLSGQPGAPGSVYIKPGGKQLGIETTIGVGFRFGARGLEASKSSVQTAKADETPRMKTCPGGAQVAVSQECPPQAMTVSVSSSADSGAAVCAGTKVTFTAAPSIPAEATATYAWTVNDQKQDATGKTLEVDTTGKDAGSYTVSVTVASPLYQNGSGSATLAVQAYQAPSGTVSASPAEIDAGQTSTLSANFSNRCGGPVGAAKFTASEGAINGNTFDSSTVQFDPAAGDREQRKSITITAAASDDKANGTATTTITVRRAADVKPKRLADLIYAPGKARVNNCAKRVLLEELKQQIDRDPTGRIVFVGHIDPSEKRSAQLDRQRALNAAAVMSGGSGICLKYAPAQILIGAEGENQSGADFQPFFCGTSATPKTEEKAGQGVSATDKKAQNRRVEVWFVPTGGALPDGWKAYKDATAYNVGSLGCPK